MSKTRKVKLQRRRHGGLVGSIEWSASVPFAMSQHGVLVHRVRFGRTIPHGDYARLWKGSPHHDSVTYWCGNGTCSPLMFEYPPDGRIMCAECERRAVKAGEKTTDELAGKHVHKGVLMARKTCCMDLN